MVEKIAELNTCKPNGILTKASGADISAKWRDAVANANSLILVTARFLDGTTNRCMVLNILKDTLSSTLLSYMNGANVSAGYLYVVNVTTSSISNAVYNNGTNITANCTFDVYYD